MGSTFPASARAKFPPQTGMSFVRGPLQAPVAPEWSRPPAQLGRTLTLRAHYDALTGYGQLACGLTARLAERGVPVQCLPMTKPWEPLEWGDAASLPEAVQERLTARNEEGWELLLASPQHAAKVSPCLHLTMWESNRLPEGAVATLNQKQTLIVPSEWAQLAFDAAGVTRPIYQLNLPVEDCFLVRRPFPVGGPFTFGLACRRAHGGLRKGVMEACQAFQAAFPTQRDVRLRLKLYPDCESGDLPRDDPRLEIIQAAYTREQLVEWFASLHCYLSMSHAEGFGLCQAQAMGVGRPVIGVQGHAQAEYLSAETGFPVAYDLVAAEKVNAENGYYMGFVWVPRKESVVETMRECYGKPWVVEGRGAVAHDLASERFRWIDFVDGVRGVLRAEGLPVS